MKTKILLSLLFGASCAFGQYQTEPVFVTAADASGSCSLVMVMQYNPTSGKLFVCHGGTWEQLTGSGAMSGFASGVFPKGASSSTVASSNLTEDADGTDKAGKALTWAAPTTPTSGSTTTCDWSQSNVCAPTALGANVTTLTLSNPHGSGPYRIIWTQDGTGGRTVTFPATVLGGAQPDPTAAAVTIQDITWDGSHYQAGPANVTNSAWHGVACPEGTAPAALSGTDYFYCDSTVHRMKALNHGGAATTYALFADNLSVFAATTSAQLRTLLSDESGTGVAYFQGGDAGTPSAIVLTNASGLPIAAITGLGTGIGTLLGTPSSANLRAALTDESGTGAAYFQGGDAGTPSAINLANATGLPAIQVPATPVPSPGTSITLAAPRGFGICTGTCTVSVPVPAAGYEFCVWNDDNIATAITLSALGSSAMYENSARTAYGTAGTGTLVVAAAAKNKVCIVGRDATHYHMISNDGGAITVN